MSDEREASSEPPDEAGEHEDLDGVVLDENFVRAARIKEPSARARMLAAQWARQPPTAASAGEVEPEIDDEADQVDQPAPTPHPWGRFWRTVRTGAVVLTVLALIVVVLGENYFSARPPAEATRAGTLPGLGPAANDPFAGTPADNYANGPEGITLPDRASLRDTQDFSATDIDNALTTARQILIEANLNPRTLRGGGPPMAVEDWLESADRDRMERTFGKPAVGGDPTDFVTRFDPSQTELVGSVVKVKGTMTYRVLAPTRLAVYATYLFVYPVRPVNTTAPARRVVVRRFNEFDFYAPGTTPAAVNTPSAAASATGALGAGAAASPPPPAVQPSVGQTPAAVGPTAPAPPPAEPIPSSDADTSPIRVGATSSDFAGVRCQPPDGYLHPDFSLGTTTQARPAGASVDAYDIARPYNPAARCVLADRT